MLEQDILTDTDRELTIRAGAVTRMVKNRMAQIEKATADKTIVDQSYLYGYLAQEAQNAKLVLEEVSYRRSKKIPC